MDVLLDEDIPGTPSYLAPEMFEGNAGDEATDVYALGVTLYRMFTAQYPSGESEGICPTAVRSPSATGAAPAGFAGLA